MTRTKRMMNWRYGWLLLLMLAMTGISKLEAQKILQMEKIGTLKVKKFYIGNEIIFRLKGDKAYWYQESIEDILVDDGIIIFKNRAVRLEEIDALRTYKPSRFGRSMSRNLFVFAGSWVLFSGIGNLAYDWEIGRSDAYVVGTALVSGILIRLLFKKRTYRMGKKRRLRLLNLDWKPRL